MQKRSLWKAAVGFACLLNAWPALAIEFDCEKLVSNLVSPTQPIAPIALTETSRLRLSIDEAQPGRSTMRWSGDPQTNGVISQWPQDVKLFSSQGVIAVRYVAAAGMARSFGSVTINPAGGLRMTEDRILPNAITHEVIEGLCRRIEQ